jgi:pilus assembly protein Flp/PilA
LRNNFKQQVSMHFFLKSKSKQSRGAALIEYGILAGLVSVVAIAAVVNLGDEVDDTFTAINSSLDTNLAVVGGGTGGGAGGGGAGGGGGDPETNPAWTDLSSYPASGGTSCTDVADGGAFDSSYNCFNVNLDNLDEVNFAGTSGPLTFYVTNGAGTDGQSDSNAITPTNAGSATIVTPGANSHFWLDTMAGDDYVLFPNRSCSDMGMTDWGMGRFELLFGDGARITLEGKSLQGIYCAGDDTVVTEDEINALWTSEDSGGMGGF